MYEPPISLVFVWISCHNFIFKSLRPCRQEALHTLHTRLYHIHTTYIYIQAHIIYLPSYKHNPTPSFQPCFNIIPFIFFVFFISWLLNHWYSYIDTYIINKIMRRNCNLELRLVTPSCDDHTVIEDACQRQQM